MSDNVQFQLAGGQNPLILVPAYVNGKGPYRFVLDTGASQCVLSPELARTLGIQAETEKQAMGAGGPVKISLAHVNSLVIGSALENNVQVAITGEIERIGAAIRAKVDGDVGFNFLKHFRLTLDYRHSLLSLVRPPDTANGNGVHSASAIPFKLASASKPLILVSVFVNNQGPFQFAVDTGASSTMLAPDLARKLGLYTTEVGFATGGGGQIKISAAKVSSLTVGNASVREHNVGVGEFLNMLSAAISVKLDGIIGYNFLNQFRVTIDYSRTTLELNSIGDF
jgi:predicted aspartyl protease